MFYQKTQQALGGMVALCIVAAAVGGGAGLAHAEPPACDTEDVVDDVIFTFNTVQDYELKSGVEMSTLHEIREIAEPVGKPSEEWAETRACAATAALSSGEAIDVWYKIHLKNPDQPDDYRLELCFSKYDPLHDDCAQFTPSEDASKKG